MSNDTNPTLIPGTHELSVEDNKSSGASVNLTIAEPTILVTPDVAGPRDYITITGENWPVDNLDNSLNRPRSSVQVEDQGGATGRTYPVYADNCWPLHRGAPGPSQGQPSPAPCR